MRPPPTHSSLPSVGTHSHLHTLSVRTFLHEIVEHRYHVLWISFYLGVMKWQTHNITDLGDEPTVQIQIKPLRAEEQSRCRGEKQQILAQQTQ